MESSMSPSVIVVEFYDYVIKATHWNMGYFMLVSIDRDK